MFNTNFNNISVISWQWEIMNKVIIIFLYLTRVYTLFFFITSHTKDRFRFMLFNATFNNISVISWWSVFLVEETGVPRKTTDLSQVIGKLYHINSSRGIFTNAIVAFGRSATNNKSYFESIKLKLCEMYEDS